MKLQGRVIANARLDLTQLFDYITETRNHQFLFRREVSDYIDEVYSKGVNVYAQLSRNAAPPEPASATELLAWFNEQEKVAREKFLKYMDFTEP